MQPDTSQTEPSPLAQLRKAVFEGSLKECSILFAVVFVVLAGPARAVDTFVYFGSHGEGANIGFSLAHFDTDTGKLTTPVFLTRSGRARIFHHQSRRKASLYLQFGSGQFIERLCH